MNTINTINQDIQATTFTLVVNEVSSDFISVPVVMMLPGVHAGSHGALLHTEEGLQSAAEQWVGKPVVISHPQNDKGEFISAYSEGVVAVGSIISCEYSDGKLRAVLSLSVPTLKEQSMKAYTAITTGKAVEVSIGAYSEENKEEGEWNGESYVGICTNYTPDHLAILPNQIGACSWEDGCGIRVNHKTENKKKGETEMDNNELMQALRDNNLQPMQVNVVEGMKETLDKMYAIVWGMDNDFSYNYLEEVYADRIVFRREPRNGHGTQTKYYQQAYTVGEAGEITLQGDPEVVGKSVVYTPVVMQANEQANERVNALIANAGSGFTECDRAWLLTQSDEVLDRLAEMGKVIQTNATPEPVIETAPVTQDTVKEFLTNASEEVVEHVLPAGMRAGMMEGLRLYAEKRKGLIQAILTQSKDVWVEDDLTMMTMEMLEKIQRTHTTPVNYAAQAPAGQTEKKNKGITPLMPTIE